MSILLFPPDTLRCYGDIYVRAMMWYIRNYVCICIYMTVGMGRVFCPLLRRDTLLLIAEPLGRPSDPDPVFIRAFHFHSYTQGHPSIQAIHPIPLRY